MQSPIAKTSNSYFAARKLQHLILVLLTVVISVIPSYGAPCSLTCSAETVEDITAAHALTARTFPTEAATESLAKNESRTETCCALMSRNSQKLACCETPARARDLLSTALFKLHLGELVAVSSVLNSFQVSEKFEKFSPAAILLQPVLLAAASIKLYILNRSLLI